MPKTKAAVAPLGRGAFDWDDVRVFNAVAETGSMAAAARFLSVTPSMVSKRVDELEARLGSTLLHRTANGVSLTDAGVMVRDHARMMEQSATSIGRMASAQDKRREGRVTIAAPDGVAAFWLAPNLSSFLQQNPKICLAIDCGFWADHPMPEAPDLLVTFAPEKRLDYVAVKLGVLHYMLFAAQSYIDIYGRPTSLASIGDHRFLNFLPISQQTENWHPKAEALRAMVDFSMETNSSAMLLQTLLAGGGVAVAPTAVRSFAANLVCVYPEPMARIQMWLVYHRDAADTTRVRVAIDWLKGIFDARRHPWFGEVFVHPDEF